MRISDWSSDVCSSDLLRRQHRGFLVAREQEDDRALRLETVLAELGHRRHHHRYVELVVLRPAAEDIAILLDRLEGLARPALRVRLNHIHMTEAKAPLSVATAFTRHCEHGRAPCRDRVGPTVSPSAVAA